jgi:hypothetical protein
MMIIRNGMVDSCCGLTYLSGFRINSSLLTLSLEMILSLY